MSPSPEGRPAHYWPCCGCSNRGIHPIENPASGRTIYYCASCYERETEYANLRDEKGWYA